MSVAKLLSRWFRHNITWKREQSDHGNYHLIPQVDDDVEKQTRNLQPMLTIDNEGEEKTIGARLKNLFRVIAQQPDIGGMLQLKQTHAVVLHNETIEIENAEELSEKPKEGIEERDAWLRQVRENLYDIDIIQLT